MLRNLYLRCKPLANERKNSLFFESHKMARVSAAYHSIVFPCKLQMYSILKYLKKTLPRLSQATVTTEKCPQPSA